MKALRLIYALLFVCVLLTLVTLVAPVMHTFALPYLSFSVAALVGVLCIVALVSHLVRR